MVTSYIEQFAACLDAAFPHWNIGTPQEPRRCFFLEVACPSAAVDAPLRISAAEYEVTVNFHTAQRRFRDFHQAVELVRSLLDETRVVDSWYSGPYMRGSSFRDASESPRSLSSATGIT